MSQHRRPPLPHWKSPVGYCRWCGLHIKVEPTGLVVSKVRRWHHECVVAFKIAAWPAESRKAVFAKDRGRCAICRIPVGSLRERYHWWHWTRRNRKHDIGDTVWSRHRNAIQDCIMRPVEGCTAQYTTWECDHIVPLIEAPAEIHYWSLANLRIACTACHKAETAKLAHRRAVGRKAGRRPSSRGAAAGERNNMNDMNDERNKIGWKARALMPERLRLIMRQIEHWQEFEPDPVYSQLAERIMRDAGSIVATIEHYEEVSRRMAEATNSSRTMKHPPC